MAKAIFTTRISPSYDDLPEERYHFPRTYLNQAREAVGDNIIYYEPGRSNADGSVRGGRQSYFAVARVDTIVEDENLPDHFYALMSGYINFDHPIPFAINGMFFESQLRKPDGTVNRGAFGRSVRLISDQEFDNILKVGFAPEIEAQSEQQRDQTRLGFDEPPALFEHPIVEQIVSRSFRDRLFTKIVRSAYEYRCAATGLQIINGGGRPEVQAAHIRPVALNGPDSIRNGIALSGTVHWLFDRGLLSVDEDYKLRAVEKSVPSPLLRLLNKSGKLILPDDKSSWPHPAFLRYHRENIFKG